MDSLGDKYLELCNFIPLRLFRSDEEYILGEDLCSDLRDKLARNELSDDEIEYLEVLDLLLQDYADEMQVDEDYDEETEDGTDLDPEDDDKNDSDLIAEELASTLADKKKEMQEWDFVQLCNNLSTVISKELSELESDGH